MDGLFEIISVQTFWRILLFIHFVMAVALLMAITLQTVAVFMPAPQTQAAGGFRSPFRPIAPASYVPLVVILYVPTFLLGLWVYIKYRTYVRIPMEQLGHWWTVGSFEFKEHIVSMGIALLPAYWYFWRYPSAGQGNERKWLTLFLLVTVWYAFLSGHTANDFRGVGS